MKKLVIEIAGPGTVLGVYTDDASLVDTVEYLAIDTSGLYEDDVEVVRQHLRRLGRTKYVERAEGEWRINRKTLPHELKEVPIP